METHHLEARPLDLVLSQHPEHETTLSDLQGRRCCSRPAIASHLTIIGLAVVGEVLLVIEVSLSRRRRSAKTGRAERPRGAQKGFVRYTEARLPRQRRENSFSAHEAEKCLPWKAAVRLMNLQVRRNMIQGNRSYLLYPCVKLHK